MLLIVFLIRTIGFGLYQVPTGSMETTMLVGERFFADKLSYNFRAPKRGEIISFNDPEYIYSNNYFKKLFEKYVWGPSNWTKRVIGIPGDVIQGKIENGRPTVYRNGEKLDEMYLNKYPLIHLFKMDPKELSEHIKAEIDSAFKGRYADEKIVNQLIIQKLSMQTTWRSYDESASFMNQPFYRIYADRIIRDEDNELQLLRPGTPLPVRNNSKGAIKSGNYWTGGDEFYIELADDEYWGMGDNREGSKDCRVFGPIHGEFIHGRILFRIWSIDSDEAWWIFDLIKNPVDFWSRIRWSRFFQFLT